MFERYKCEILDRANENESVNATTGQKPQPMQTDAISLATAATSASAAFKRRNYQNNKK